MSELTDLEICKRIAKIDGANVKSRYAGTQKEYLYLDHVDEEYNPLTDKAICWDLMIKHDIEFTKGGGFQNYRYGARFDHFVGSKQYWDKDLPRAICMAIIEAHND